MRSPFSMAFGVLIGGVLAAGSAQAQSISLSVGGEVAPGVYGRVDIGNAPPPPVVYTQPVLVAPPPPAVVAPAPIYMHVPPGQARQWGRYCHRYNACGVPVYFVRGPEYGPPHGGPGRGDDDRRRRGDDDRGPGWRGDGDRGPGWGHGHGRGD